MPKITATDATEATVEAATVDATTAEETPPTLTRAYGVEVLEDGRVKSKVQHLHEENDELGYKCSQERAAKFVLNDVAPEIK